MEGSDGEGGENHSLPKNYVAMVPAKDEYESFDGTPLKY